MTPKTRTWSCIAPTLATLLCAVALAWVALGAGFVQPAYASDFTAQITSAEWLDNKTVEIAFDQSVELAPEGRSHIQSEQWWASDLDAGDSVVVEGTKATITFAKKTASNVNCVLFNEGALQDAAGNVNVAQLKAAPPAPKKVVTKLTYTPTELDSNGGTVVAALEGKFLNDLGGWISAKVYEGDTLVDTITPTYSETAHTFTFRLPANTGTEDKQYKLKFTKDTWTTTPVEVLEGANDVVTVSGLAVAQDPEITSVTYNATSFKAAGGTVVATITGEALTQLTASDISLKLGNAAAGIAIDYKAETDQKATATFTLPANTSTTDAQVYTFNISKGASEATGVPQDITVNPVNTNALVESIEYIDQALNPYHFGAGDFVLYYHGGTVKVVLEGENLNKLTANDFVLEEKTADGFKTIDGQFTISNADESSALVTFVAPANEDITNTKVLRFSVLCAQQDIAGTPQLFTLDHANESLEGKFRIDANKGHAARVGDGVVRVRVDAPSVALNPLFDDDKVADNERLDVKDYIFFANTREATTPDRALGEGDKVSLRDGDLYIEFADKTAPIPSWILLKGGLLVSTETTTVGTQEISKGDVLATRDENNHLHHSLYIQQTPHIESIEYSQITFTKEGGTVTATMKGSRLNESDPALWAKVFVDSEKEYSTEIVPEVQVNAEGDQAVATFTVPANNTDRTISYRLIPVIDNRNVISLYLKGYDVVSVLPDGGKTSDTTLSSVEIQGGYDLDDNLDVFATSTSAEKFTAKIDVILRGTNLSSKQTAVRAVDENGVVWPTIPVFECGATIRWQNSSFYLAERESKNEQHIELLLPRRLGVSHTFTLQFAPDGKNFLDAPTGTVIVENNGLFDLNDMELRQFTKDDLTKLINMYVKYVDESGKELAPKDTYKGYGITEMYHQKVAPKDIEGYTLKKYTPNNLDNMLAQPIQRPDGDYDFTPNGGQFFFRDLAKTVNPQGASEPYTIFYIYQKNVDKTALEKSIKAAQDSQKGVKTSKDGSDVSTKDTYVTPVEAKQLAEALDYAATVAKNPNATQAQVDAAAKRLDSARAAYDKAKKPGKKAPVTTKTALKSATAKNQNYTGKALKPAVTVKDAKGNTVPTSAYTVKYTNNVNPGTATATVTAKKDSKYTGTVKATFKITAKDTPVYWLYNKNTGENLYTAALPEKNALSKKPQWQFKKIVWYAPTTGEPVYRLVNKVTNDHHWTKSKTEANTLVKRGKWKMDFNGKPAFYSGGGKTVWRLRHDARITQQKAGTHRFATSTNEVNTLKKSKWVKESETLLATRYK